MDSKKFFGKIREIIREEIDYALEKKLVKPNVNVNDIKEVKALPTTSSIRLNIANINQLL